MSTDDTTADRDLVAPPDLRALAVRRLHRRREFTQHLVAYLIVNGALWAVWAIIALAGGATFPWPLFPMAGWGIGLAFHAWSAFGPPSRPIDETAVAREMDRLAQRR
ncbi:2TM domain-containing protein [Geodermatophilus sp. SYSU D00766]